MVSLPSTSSSLSAAGAAGVGAGAACGATAAAAAGACSGANGCTACAGAAGSLGRKDGVSSVLRPMPKLKPRDASDGAGVGAAFTSASIPVATTDTRMRPSSSGLKAEPQMMFASGSTRSRMWFAASSTSSRRMSSPPVIEMMTPLAPCIDTPSSSGLAIAFCAASSARLSPSASPVPIIALPISCITDRTSAKSRLIRPGMTIRSVIPRTPCCRTSSAIENASLKVVFALAIRNRFWLGMTISVSTNFCSSSIPPSAALDRRLPSNANGLVTTPTVRMPMSRAALAITGAAPVPVPPPMPAAMNTMWQPSSCLARLSIVSSAAARPISGRAPAPSPCVILAPNWMRLGAFDCFNACASVLATRKSTPWTSARIMFAIALPPAPPTPITAMRGVSSSTSGAMNSMLIQNSPPSRNDTLGSGP